MLRVLLHHKTLKLKNRIMEKVRKIDEYINVKIK